MKKVSLLAVILLLLFISCSKEKEDDLTIEKFHKNSKVEADVTETENEIPEKVTDIKKSGIQKISTKEVNVHVGDSVIVEGMVADVFKNDRVAYLNFDQRYPKNTIAGTIFASRFTNFSDLYQYKNKKVQMTGKITTYKNKPQIILDSEEQVKIIE